MNFAQLNTVNTFKNFLTEYHKVLQKDFSFPPLGLGKALHASAPLFEYDNWFAMEASVSAQAKVNIDDFVAYVADHIQHFNAIPSEYTQFNEKTGEEITTLDEDQCFEMAKGLGLCALINDNESFQKTTQPVVTEPERMEIVIVTILEADNADNEAFEHIYSKPFRSMDDAEKEIKSLVDTKATNNDRTKGELVEFTGVVTPDEDELEEMDEQEVLDYILENNNMYDLIDYISYLDYNLTKIEVSQDWI